MDSFSTSHKYDFIPVSSIKVGERVRKDKGDIESLAQSMASLGLLNPIIVTPDTKLLCGQQSPLHFSIYCAN